MAAPDQVVQRFQRRVQESLAYYDELVLAVHGKKRQRSLETMLAEQCVMGLAVLWEAFLHDVLIAHIEEKCTTCVDHFTRRVQQSLDTKFKAAGKWVTVDIPMSLSRSQIEIIVDPEGRNITANSAQDLATRATNLLVASRAKKFSLEVEDRQFVDFLIALRNYLAHRSSTSLRTLKTTVKSLTVPGVNATLPGQISSVGAFLKSKPAGSVETRAKLIGLRLIALSAKLS